MAEFQRFHDILKDHESVKVVHSPPHTQSLNPVECAVRQLYHLINFFLTHGHLSAFCWSDMARAAAYTMNRLPHPQSKVRARRTHSAHELATGKKPDLSDMIAGPGELIVVDRQGVKANSGCPTGEYCYFICPHEAGWLVCSFESNKLLVTREVRKLSAPDREISTLVSLRHAIHSQRDVS